MKQLLLLVLIGIFIGSETNAYTPGPVEAESITFDLLNKSLTSIPLRIPGVMNPNLSPQSRSGVSLEVGQEIFFYHKKRKYLLLVVSEDLEAQKVDVAKLIKERKKELGLDS